MDGVRLQAKRLRELQDYVDAQSGGPGKGWFRIVTTPFEARRVINQGKLAVVMGIEVSKLFDCGVQDGQPECTAEQVDARLKEVYDLGVRDMELVNKFDNGFARRGRRQRHDRRRRQQRQPGRDRPLLADGPVRGRAQPRQGAADGARAGPTATSSPATSLTRCCRPARRRSTARRRTATRWACPTSACTWSSG